MGRKKELTEKRFKNLLTKASQPLPEQGQKPDSSLSQTLESPTSGDYNGIDTHSDKSGDI